MVDIKQAFREFLVTIEYPSNLISIEVAWMSQQPRGAAGMYIDSVKILREFLYERRQRDE